MLGCEENNGAITFISRLFAARVLLAAIATGLHQAGKQVAL